MSEQSEPDRVLDVEGLDEARLRTASRLIAAAALPGPLLVALPWIDRELIPLAVLGLAFASGLVALAFFLPVLPALLRARIGGDGEARVDADGGLTITRGGRRLRVAPERLALAWTREPKRVEVLLHDGELRLGVTDEAAAARLVTAIREVAGRERAYAVALESPSLRLARQSFAAWAPLAIACFFLLAGPRHGLPALTVALTIAVLGGFGTPRLRFGADGVQILGRLRRRYVPYRAIRGVRLRRTFLSYRSVKIVLDDGRELTVAPRVEAPRAWLVRALIDEGRRMAEAGEAAGAKLVALERDDADDDAWRDRAAALVRGADYRHPAVDADRLWSLMRNPAADPEQRVGAALALRDDPAGRRRIRVAADVSAEPVVRAALEALAAEALAAADVQRALRRLDRAVRGG